MSFFKSKSFKITFFFTTILLAVLGGYQLFNVLNKPEPAQGEYTTTKVSVGNIFQVIEAQGETAAENEVLILCPNNGIVKQVLRLPGSKVSKGEVILTMDRGDTQAELDAAEDQLEIMNNNLHKLKLNARTSKIDLEHDIEVKKLKIASLKAELEDQNELMEVGGISQAKIDRTKQALVLAEKELVRSSQKHHIKLKQLKAEEKGTQLQISIKEKEIAAKKEQIRKTIVRSPGTGIILEVRARKGENKRKNELLVRISEHTHLKIKGEVSEKYSSAIRNGGKVFARIDGNKILGTIGNIQPELEDDKIQFDVFLESPQNELLKVNQNVDIYIVEKERTNVVRVKRSEYFDLVRSQCFVINNSEVEAREIKTGLKGLDFIEIVQGLDSGEVVVNAMKTGSKKTMSREIEGAIN